MSVFSPGLGRKGVKLRVTDVYQEDEHYGCRISFARGCLMYRRKVRHTFA
jgi:hypothetical protein